MEKNWIVCLSCFEDDGGYGHSSETEYGPYSLEEAERVTSQLNEKIDAGDTSPVHISAGVVELQPKTFEEIFEEDLREKIREKQTPAETAAFEERMRLASSEERDRGW